MLLRKNQVPHLMMQARIKAKIDHVPLLVKLLILKLLLLIKATTSVKTGTQMIEMIKILLLAAMRIEARREARMIKALKRIDVTLDKVSAALTSKRSQEVNFQALVNITHTSPW